MDPMSVASVASDVQGIAFALLTSVASVASDVQGIAFALLTSGPRSIIRLVQYVRLYGVSGLVIWLLGDNSVWHMQAQVLGSQDDDVAMGFRNSIQNECTMKAVAGAILAQIAITALSLPYPHWVARGAWIVSLVTALMAGYYTNVQHRAMGRLLRPRQVRAWIGGKQDWEPAAKALDREQMQREYSIKDFLPMPTSVLTVSAPDRLLLTALNAFLAGLGVYLGVIWQAHLDTDADGNDSKHVFVAYIVSVSVCYIIYSLSSVLQKTRESDSLEWIVVDNMEAFIKESERHRARTPIQQQDADNLKRRPMQQDESNQPVDLSPADNLGRRQEDVEALGPTIEPVRAYHTPISPTLAQSHPCHLKATRNPAPTISTEQTTEGGPGKPEERLLIDILRKSAKLRRESAEVDERLAQYYERLLECPEVTRSIT